MADTPETESVPTTDEQAVDLVSRMMEPEEPTVETKEEEPPEPADEPEGETPPEEEASSEEPSVEPESEEEETVEIPDTIDGLAEELGVSPEDLASHLKINVTVNGETRAVTLAEARTGQQLDQDYRQKTMELAEKRKAQEAEHAQALERWQQGVQRLDETISLTEKLFGEPDREDLKNLLEEDPWQYQRVKADIDHRNEVIGKLKDEQKQIREEAMKDVEKRQAEFRSQQQNLLAEKFPDVKDPEKLRMFEKSASDYLKMNGYTDEEIASAFTLFDHRNILMLRDGMAYRAMERGKSELTKKVKPLPRVQKPGTPGEKKDTLTASRDRLKRLKRSGTKQQQTEGAVEYVKTLLG